MWCAEPGRIMEKYYLQFETMKAITKAPERSSIEDLLLVLTNAEELSCTLGPHFSLQQELNVFSASFSPVNICKPNSKRMVLDRDQASAGRKKKIE
jgi:hypothetical protein